jgi:FkbM family methyltransferase
MLNFVTEQQSCWERMRLETKPIYLYGMGNGAVKILTVMKQYGIRISGVFASDNFVRGHSFAGFKVEKLADIEQRGKDFAVVLAFGAGYPELLEHIENIASRHTLYVPDVPVIGGGLFTYDYCLLNRDKIQTVYDMLDDGFSKSVYANIINFKISGDITYLKSTETVKDHIYKDILTLNNRETFIDLGAFTGDTIDDFLSYTESKYRGIIAFEPDPKNYRKLVRNTEGLENVYLYNAAAWSIETELPFLKVSGRQASLIGSRSGHRTQDVKMVEAKSIDGLGVNPTYIKIDVEGAENEALWGGAKVIAECKPKLSVSIYHRVEDIFEIPLLIKNLNPEYSLYIRRLPYIPAWDTNCYAV